MAVPTGPAIAAEACTAAALPASVSLPEPTFRGVAVEEALRHRRTARQFSKKPLDKLKLSQLLWAAQGITEPRTGFRTAPSAGGAYPIDLYIVPNQVEGLPCGVYRYRPQQHVLERHAAGNVRREVFEAAAKQQWVYNAALVIVFVATPERVAKKYGESHARKSVLLEAGHISQNIYLQATSLRLGAGAIGGFSAEQLHRLLALGEKEEVVYLNLVGLLD
jgi:SagB-type dehydrogenase family enzyme